MAMSKVKAAEVLNDRDIAKQVAEEFSAYFGDTISGPMVALDAEQYNAMVGAWEQQEVTRTLADYIQNAIIRAKK